MDKRNRLGWVPMLLKAYNDAKQALEAKMQELEQNQPSAGNTEKLSLSAPLAKQPITARSYLQDLPRSVTEPETRSTRSHLQASPRSLTEPETRSTRSHLQASPRSLTEPETRSTRSHLQAPPRSVAAPETRSSRSQLQAPLRSVTASGTKNTRSNVQAPVQSRLSAKAAKRQNDTNNRPASRNDAASRYTRSMKRTKRQENSLNYPRVVPSAYQSVVRELQETRRRLNRIETVQSDRLLSIQEELKRMQEKLDRRILEITAVLGKHKSHRT